METMNAASSRYSVSIPNRDRAIFREMARRMGWETKRIRNIKAEEIYEPNATTLRAMQAVREGKVYKASSAEDLINQILG